MKANMSNTEAEEHKKKGNDSFKEKDWEGAIKHYNKAITLDPDNAAYYSNRAAAWSQKGNHESALADANRCVDRDPSFMKGYTRKGKALFDLGRWDEAEAAYKDGLKISEGNPECTRGLQDIATHRSSQRPSFSGMGGGNLGGMFTKLVEKVKSGGRLQMYLVFMVGYFMLTNFTGRNRSGKSSSSPAPAGGMGDESWSEHFPVRSFQNVEGTWLSLLQSEAQTQTLLLMLHQTSLSAEADYGKALATLSADPSDFSEGIRLLAPDRPCHGFSPCVHLEEEWDWLDGLLAARPPHNKLVLAATGREAAQKALQLTQKRPRSTKLLLLSPKLEPPILRANLTSEAEARAWLAERGGRSPAPALADALRWATAGATRRLQKSKLEVGPASGAEVTILYAGDEEEDDTLSAALEAKGARVTARSSGADMHGAMVEELRKMLSTEDEGRSSTGVGAHDDAHEDEDPVEHEEED